MHLNETLNLIRDLLSPASGIDQTNLSKISLNTIIENCLNNFDSKHKNNTNTNVIFNDIQTDDCLWRFGLIGLKLLKLLNESDFESSPTGTYLSINDERMIAQCCQLIVCFTIHYNLEDNIGIPIEKLSRYGVNLTQKRALLSPQIRNERLYATLCILHTIKNVKRQHLDLIPMYFYRKYLHEIICALIQAVHSVNRFKDDEEKLSKWLLEDLFEECDGASLVSNLIMAQGTRPNKETMWFTSRIGQLLTKCLLKPNSVMNVIRAVLTEMNAVSSVTVASDWKKCDIVAKILAQCPKEVKLDDYFQLLTPQVLSLYFCQDIKFSRHFLRVSGSIYSLFSQRYPQMTQEYLTKQILSGFRPIFLHSQNDTLTMSQKQLKEELNKFFLVYIQSTEPNQYAFGQIPKKLVFFLFKIYVGLKKRVNCEQINRNLRDFLQVYINLNNEPCNLLNELLLSVTDVGIKLNLEFFSDDNDENSEEAIVWEKVNSNEDLTLTMTEEHCQGLISLIENLDTIKLNLMIFMLKKLTEEKKAVELGGQKLLLEIEEGLIRQSRDINEKIIYFTSLSRLFEIINVELIVKNFEEIINFCQILIENFSKYSNLIEEELIQLVLSIVSVFTSGTIEIEYEVKQKLQILLPGLLNLKENFSNLEEMIDSLYVSIATYTGVTTEKVLIEELSDEYSRVLKDVNDPFIPVSAHGFVELRKLIEKKDEKCLQNVDKLVDLTLKGVKNEDSYLYLAAINTMIALAVYVPKKLLDPLIEQFISEKKLNVDDRLKIGEVLTKTIRNFNELVPLYAPKLINAFLIGVKLSDDGVFQSSCLSSLGEICKLLNFSIQNDIYEILSCLSALLETHKSLQVKRSAIMVLKMIVEGLKKENFIQVLGSSLTPLYKLLIKIKNTSQDDIVILNCQLTSDYINEMMLSSMFPKQVLQKEIRVLRP